MCGIIGYTSLDNINVDIYKRWLINGRDLLIHRGPDDKGAWFNNEGNVGLGHRRLSIIDLSVLGHQPMFNVNNDLCIVFNGEIYNYLDLKKDLLAKGHILKSDSDTEVVLAAYSEWGNNFMNHLNGMFSLAIYNLATNRILLVRDRAGEKPMFYSIFKNTLIFASELKALLLNKEIGNKIDKDAINCYLSMGYVPGELCIINGVNKLPPAHALEFDLNKGNIKKWKYWSLPEIDENVLKGALDEKSLVDELEYLLEDSVKRQMVSDVPLGVLLSGGVDSSLITAMAARSGNKIKTFTVGFPEHSKFDERSHAKLIADYFSTEHTELNASDVSIDLLPRLARQYDEPIIDSSMIPTFLVSQLVRQHCIVALGGDGGDELFGGYGHYDRLLILQKNAAKIPNIIRTSLSFLSEKYLPVGFKGRVWLQSLNQDLNNGLPLIASYFDTKTRKSLLEKGNFTNVDSVRKKLFPSNSDIIQRATRMDFLTYLPEDILVKVDRASMLNSLEVRAPMLDFRIIEFAFSKVPTSLKTTTSNRKIILKKLVAKVLPESFDQQRKQGFGVPIGDWFRKGEWNTFLKETLLNSRDPIFNVDIVKKIIEGHEKGYNNTERLFGLLMFELWRKDPPNRHE